MQKYKQFLKEPNKNGKSLSFFNKLYIRNNISHPQPYPLKAFHANKLTLG